MDSWGVFFLFLNELSAGRERVPLGKVARRRVSGGREKLFLLLREGKQGAQEAEEEPLDRRIFEDVIRKGGDFQRQEEKEENAVGEAERPFRLALCVALADDIEEREEVESEKRNTYHAAFDEEFHEIIMGVIGAEARPAEGFRNDWEGVHAGAQVVAAVLDRLGGDIVPERLAPDDRAIRIR